MIKDLPSIIQPDPQQTAAAGGPTAESSPPSLPLQRTLSDESTTSSLEPPTASHQQANKDINESPGEVAFFKYVHSQVRKVNRFFELAQREYAIREQRAKEGMQIIVAMNPRACDKTRATLAKSIFHLYRDLLLLETFCIMNFCAFSKILKKHDKNTGFETRAAFMEHVVSKATFADYPQLVDMIHRCQKLYQEASILAASKSQDSDSTSEGAESTSALYEDQRLFINMINRLNTQVIQSEEVSETFDSLRVQAAAADSASSETARLALPPPPLPQENMLSTLRSIVEENEQGNCNVSVEQEDCRKRPAPPLDRRPAKRRTME